MKFARSLYRVFEKWPLISFFSSLILLLLIIILGNTLRTPKASEDIVITTPRSVSVFNFDSVPRVGLMAQVEKRNVITLHAQTSGIVSSIYIIDGQKVQRGQNLVKIADTTDGRISASISKEIATRNVQNSNETADKQHDILKERRDNIPKKDTDEYDILRKEFTIAKRDVDLLTDVRNLTLKNTQILEARNFSTAPFSGKINRIYVRSGQSVNTGDLLASLSGDEFNTYLTIHVTADVLKRLSDTALTTFTLPDGKQIELSPLSVSQDATSGTLYSLLYTIPADHADFTTDGSYISAEIPLTNDGTHLFVPLDALEITTQGASLFVLRDGKASIQDVVLKSVFGGFVEITSGLTKEDTVILDRHVTDGDRVIVQ